MEWLEFATCLCCCFSTLRLRSDLEWFELFNAEFLFRLFRLRFFHSWITLQTTRLFFGQVFVVARVLLCVCVCFFVKRSSQDWWCLALCAQLLASSPFLLCLRWSATAFILIWWALQMDWDNLWSRWRDRSVQLLPAWCKKATRKKGKRTQNSNMSCQVCVVCGGNETVSAQLFSGVHRCGTCDRRTGSDELLVSFHSQQSSSNHGRDGNGKHIIVIVLWFIWVRIVIFRAFSKREWKKGGWMNERETTLLLHNFCSFPPKYQRQNSLQEKANHNANQHNHNHRVLSQLHELSKLR